MNPLNMSPYHLKKLRKYLKEFPWLRSYRRIIVKFYYQFRLAPAKRTSLKFLSNLITEDSHSWLKSAVRTLIENEEQVFRFQHIPELYPKAKMCKAVKDYEKTLFYNKGELIGVLGGGLYELDKKARIKGTEIVWIDTSFTEIQWGIPQSEGIPTKDGYIIGLYGDLKLKISDVKVFYNDVVAGTKIWNVQDLKKWIITLLHTSLRDIFKNYKAKSVILEDRERVINLIATKVTEEFNL